MLVLECQAERVGIHQWKVGNGRMCLPRVPARWSRRAFQRSPGPAPGSKWTGRSSFLGQEGLRQEGAMLRSNRVSFVMGPDLQRRQKIFLLILLDLTGA